MSLIRPFPGLRPALGREQEVIAPPYDVLSSEEAKARARGKPWSFLHISKPEIDLPPNTDPHANAVYKKGKENFERMISSGVLRRDHSCNYYLYRLIMGKHTQTGLVVVASVADYEVNRIRKHEFTQPDKEDDRVAQINALNAQTGPVFLTYRVSPSVNELVSTFAASDPDVNVTADDGIHHSLWVIQDDALITKLTGAFDIMDYLYIADGHHRSAAAARTAAARRAANRNHRGDESYNYFLAVLFPDNQLQILDYNRVVKDLNGLSKDEFIQAIQASFNIEKRKAPVKPEGTGIFGMYVVGEWYSLTIHDDKVPQNDPVRRLDVSLLVDYLITPVLGITDPRRDKRIDFVGGIRGLQELEKRVDSGEMAVAFSLYPTSLSALMAVADAGQVMPPKSTWFEPKLADGLVSHVLD